MSSSVAVVWDDKMTSYDFGFGHPMAPVRVQLAMDLARSLGLLDRPNVHVVTPTPATDDQLRRVHDARYVSTVRGCSEDPFISDISQGLGTEDNPVFLGMHEASALVAGATLEAARAVWTGEVEHAVNLSGGMHHAMPDRASGFCVYNDLAVAIAWLLDNGAKKVAYVDVDAHHGDGVERIFWNDPRVLTVSIHEAGDELFPGTGWPRDFGGPAAEGTAVNIALPPGTGDNQWLRAFDAVVPPVLRAFGPDVIISQQGCDSHVDDPLAHLTLTVDGQEASYARLHELAHELCDGKWIATGGGGYAVVDAVPRAWAHLVGEAVGAPVAPPTETPQEWRTEVLSRTGYLAPLTMTDGGHPMPTAWDKGYDPDDPVDRAVLATMRATFPLHGIAFDDHG